MVTGFDILGQNKALQDHEIKRFFAYLIDWIIIAAISWILSAIIWPFGGFGLVFWGWGFFLFGLFAVLYWAFMEGFVGGATIGKKVMGLQVVGTTGPLDLGRVFIRNVSKFHPVLALLDWLIGLATLGDPRQKFLDRYAGTTVVRTDAQAYMEEQFRQMATPPPHPMAPQPGYVPPAYAPPPGYAPPPQQPAPPAGAPPSQAPPSWPQQQAPPGQSQAGWPQHSWDEQGRLQSQARFCSACAGPLVPRGDGHLVCSRCGAVY